MANYYFSIYKPYGMLAQFKPKEGHRVLGDMGEYPEDVYPLGKLDADTEGMLLITNDNRVDDQMLTPKTATERTYWAQVEGKITPKAIEKLAKGLDIKVKGERITTKPCKVKLIDEPKNLPERNPSIRYSKVNTHTWIELKIKEEKNRQVKKMTAKVGFPTLRLIRVAIEELKLENLTPGNVTELSENDFYNKLNLVHP